MAGTLTVITPQGQSGQGNNSNGVFLISRTGASP